MNDTQDVTNELLEELTEAFNKKDLDKIIDSFAEYGEFFLAAGPDPCGRRFQGKEEIRQALSERFAAVSDIRWVDGQHWISGNKAVSERRVQGTLPSGDRMDYPGE